LQAASHSLDALPPGTGNRPAGKPRPVQRPDPLTCTLIWPNSGHAESGIVRDSPTPPVAWHVGLVSGDRSGGARWPVPTEA
jgi:hypothetical protein